MHDVVGRTEELARISDFVTGPQGGTQVLVLDGDPGVGKTTLWEATAWRPPPTCSGSPRPAG